jgi:hypothetical protein
MSSATTYEDSVVRISELVSSDGVLSGCVFNRCRIDGPAVLVLRGGSMVDCDLGGPTSDAVLWEVPRYRPRVVGVILAEDCTFEKCAFSNVGIAGPPDLIWQLRNDGPST